MIAGEANWTEVELAETLYQRDPDPSVRIINEFRYVSPVRPTNIMTPEASAMAKSKKGGADQERDTELEDRTKSEAEGPPPALDLDLSGDQVQIVEFYAPWCPHCQTFQKHYIELAHEIRRRSINLQISFHAVSCTLNPEVCEWYEIAGYPAVMGWRGGTKIGNITDFGANLNEFEFDANTIAFDLEFDLAEETIKYDKEESKFSNSEDQREYEQNKIQKGQDIAQEKTDQYEFKHDINDRYHNAAVSLTYILKNGVYTSTKKQLSTQQKTALRDFLILVDWASPQTWDVNKVMVRDLLNHLDDIISKGKQGLTSFVEKYQNQAFKRGRRREELLWGHLDETFYRKPPRKRSIVKGALGAERGSITVDAAAIIKEHSVWTDQCTHGYSHHGFTCGLWELFHLLSIGATHTTNQLYGFREGYIISSKEVGDTIRNFIANFFRCDVCKSNFLQMYKECGHDHCKRLDTELPFAAERMPTIHISTTAMDEANGSRNEIALWLWEVHNAVNERLMIETAERERRVTSDAELIAAKFPTRVMCPKCWLDDTMEVWDRQEVFSFLESWYWPSEQRRSISWQSSEEEGTPLSSMGLYFTLVTSCLATLTLVNLFFRKSQRSASQKMK